MASGVVHRCRMTEAWLRSGLGACHSFTLEPERSGSYPLPLLQKNQSRGKELGASQRHKLPSLCGDPSA